jgi:4-amino-4-deoxy-L-arabinose transferase-like glycosyltransferase
MPARRILLILLTIAVAGTFLTPIQRELYVGDETKYSQVVREMRTGSFFLPTLEGSPFTHKPPVHFWLMNLLTYPMGVYSIWPYVLPSLLAFLLLLWLMWRIEGPLGAFICATSLMVWGSAQTARMDVSFTALLVLAAWMIRRSFDRDDSRALVIAGVATGVATLIKGPMAPVIVIVLFVFERIRRKRAPRAGYVAAILAMVVIPLLWFVPAMIQGGEAYTREVVVKQTAGRAVGSWVHKAAPWFYITHAPGDLFPWFFLLVVAVIATYKRHDEDAKFYISWILAVLVPYTLISSKLDVYMMAMIPPVALLIARFVNREIADKWTAWGRRANFFVLALLALLGLAGLFVQPRHIKGPEAELASLTSVKLLFAVLAAAAIVALVIALRSRGLVTSTLLVGFVPVAALIYMAVALVPIANELASTRPLVRAIEAQNLPPESVGLYFTPHLWVRGMSPSLERVRVLSADDAQSPPAIITSRRRAPDIGARLQAYRKTGEFRMIGKWFDVYRR